MRKLCQEEVANIFKRNNCQLLGVYCGIYKPVKYRCECGGIAKISFKSFKKGRRCPNCAVEKRAQKRRTDFGFVKRYFSDHGCELLSKFYKNCEELLIYKCSCGNMAKISFSNFKHGHRCRMCGVRCGPDNNKWNPDREKVRLAESFRKRCYGLLWRSRRSTNQVKNKRTLDLLGYNPNDLREWIMRHENWNNVKNSNWHLDHCFPIKAFIEYGISDLKIINSLQNLRPVLANENLGKQGKYSKKDFESWLKRNGHYVKR